MKPDFYTSVTHDHVVRAYAILGFEGCGGFMNQDQQQKVMGLADSLSKRPKWSKQ